MLLIRLGLSLLVLLSTESSKVRAKLLLHKGHLKKLPDLPYIMVLFALRTPIVKNIRNIMVFFCFLGMIIKKHTKSNLFFLFFLLFMGLELLPGLDPDMPGLNLELVENHQKPNKTKHTDYFLHVF